MASKRRKLERREKLYKTALCKHYGKPGGCPYPDCKFAHGRHEVADGGKATVEAQRKLIREQVLSRSENHFQEAEEKEPGHFGGRGSMIARYYTEMFACDIAGKTREDQYVHMHSNRLCVVGVSPSHVAMEEEIESVEFMPNVLENKVSGKKKKGGHFLHPDTVLGHIKCKGGNTFAIRCCMRGYLLEVNERLAENPSLLQTKPLTDGYVAIMQPKPVEVVEIQESLLSKAEFNAFRSLKPSATKPTEPAVPIEPTEPAVPIEPTEPTKPVVPIEPTEPAVPIEPTEPTKPANPTEPTEPTEPSSSE